MSSTLTVQGGSAGESIKKKHIRLLQHFATAFVRFNTFRRGERENSKFTTRYYQVI
jgi:hypothetical protein